jgi:hypothetical protein
MCPKIDVIERECKNLEVGRDLNKALVQIYRIECLPLESAMVAETRTAWRTRSASRARVRLFIFSLPLLAARH